MSSKKNKPPVSTEEYEDTSEYEEDEDEEEVDEDEEEEVDEDEEDFTENLGEDEEDEDEDDVVVEEEEEKEEEAEEEEEEEEEGEEEGDDTFEYGGDEEEYGGDEDMIIDDPDDINIYKDSVRVADENRTTKPDMTKYEVTRILGIRAKQLSENAQSLISNVQDKSPIRIAIDELLLKKIPFKIKRQMPYPEYEIWKISELNVTISQDDIDDLILAIK